MRNTLSKILLAAWYQQHPLRWLLIPISWVYWLLVLLRQQPRQPSEKLTIIVGNYTVGGTGKTEIIKAIALHYPQLKIGIAYQAYRVDIATAQLVDAANPSVFGDEPSMLLQHCAALIAVANSRADAVALLNQRDDVDIILLDDGLHSAVARDAEIVLFDARGVGNGHLIPAGPLRVPLHNTATQPTAKRFIASKGSPQQPQFSHLPVFSYRVSAIANAAGQISVATWKNRYAEQPIVALSAIANPQGFYQTLVDIGISFTALTLADHSTLADADFNDDTVYLMTAKDAVKYQHLPAKYIWHVAIELIPPTGLWDFVDEVIAKGSSD